MKSLILSLLLTLSVSFTAHAGLLVEPYIGMGTYATTSDLADADDDGNSMSVVGGRLGYSFLLVSAGLDYQMANIEDGKRNNMSAFVGVDLPILLRFWAEYTFNSTVTNDDLDDSGFDIAFKSGTSLGIGFTGLPFVSLNLEIENMKYTLEHDSVDDIDLDWAGYVFSVSLPLDL